MKRFDIEPISPSSPDVMLTAEGVRVRGMTYELDVNQLRGSVQLRDADNTPYAELSLFGGVDTRAAADELTARPVVSYEQAADTVQLRLAVESSIWERKTQVWTCRDDSVEVYYELEGQGDVTSCRYFAGSFADETMSGRFVSKAEFQTVFNPEPTSSERRTHGAAESSSINVTGLARAGMEDWFCTPAPYCFGMSRQPSTQGELPAGQWLMMGLMAPVEEQHFTGVYYDGGERSFGLRCEYEGQTHVDGSFRSPSVRLFFADDPYDGLARYAAEAQRSADVSRLPKATFDWWKEPIFCGWGAQAELSGSTIPRRSMQDFARQEVYDGFMDTLERHALHPGTITIDDKWQQTYGTNVVDREKWPDLEGWIARRHQFGQKVLLWLKAWDSEGLPPELCVTNRAGRPVTVDPSNPDYEQQLRRQVDYMLSPDGYNADGFKIDFTARTPTGQSLRRAGTEWGTSLLHRYLATIYQQAKQTKPDALVVTHTPSPWFADVTDMIRLNDVNCDSPVVAQMTHRAQLARAACPDALIDTDNWPMPSIEEWRKYIRTQPKLGVAALYFTDTVAAKQLSENDYALVRRSWEFSRRHNGRVA